MTSIKIYFIVLITFEAYLFLDQFFSKEPSRATIPVGIALVSTIVLAIQLLLDKLI